MFDQWSGNILINSCEGGIGFLFYFYFYFYFFFIYQVLNIFVFKLFILQY